MGNYTDVLIVVDMQNDFVSGSLAISGAKEIIPKIKNVIDSEYCYSDDLVVFTRDTHWNNYLETFEGMRLPVKHCLADTPGWCIVDELYSYACDNSVDKEYFSFSGWREYFQEERIVIPRTIKLVGVATDICVVSNALVLRNLYPNMPISVDADCCAGTSKEFHDAALAVMQSCQIDILNWGGLNV